MEKNNKGLIITLIILILCLCGSVGYTVYDKVIKKETITEEKEETKKDQKVEKIENPEDNKEEVKETTNENSNQEILKFDGTKCAKQEQCSDYEYELVNWNAFNGEIDVSIIDGNKIHIGVNYGRIKDSWGINSSETYKDYTLSFDKKIEKYHLDIIGQNATGACMFLLMEDGSVEYIPLYDAIKDNNIKSYGKISDIENISNLYTVEVRTKNSPIGGQLSVIALKSDGSFYDLRYNVKFKYMY